MGMAKKVTELGEKLVGEIEAAWGQPQEDWPRKGCGLFG